MVTRVWFLKIYYALLKLAQDNQIYLEFYAHCCFIKDKAIGETQLRGTLRDGLYQLERVIIKIGAEMDSEQQLVHKNKGISTFVLSGGRNLANTNFAISKAVWRMRLGHPSSKILN